MLEDYRKPRLRAKQLATKVHKPEEKVEKTLKAKKK